MNTAQLNCFTKRERTELIRITRGQQVNDSFNIDPKKLAIAKHFPEVEWDIEFFRLQAFTNALTQMANYNSAKVPAWTWHIRHTPSSICERQSGEMVNVKPIAHPRYMDQFIELIAKTPLSSIDAYCDIIKDIGHPSIKCIGSDTADKNGHFTRLSWIAGPYNNENLLYLDRNRHA